MPLPVIIPPNPIEANVDYRYDGCYQSMVLVLLQRIVDGTDDASLIAKLQEIIDELTELNGKVATEATLEASRVLLASIDGKDFATQTTLALIEAITAQMTFTGGDLNVNASVSLPAGLATEAKQDAQIVLETAANALLTSLDGKDYATQTTLELIRLLLVSLDGKDYATETTLALIKPVLDAIKLDTANLDVALSTRATEATLLLMEAITSQMTFTGGNLNVNAAVNVTTVFGDTGGYANLTPNGASQQVLAASTDFKEVILYHENKKQAWIKFGGGAAAVGEGFPLKKKQIWVIDKCRDNINIIFESGFDSNQLQVNTVKL